MFARVSAPALHWPTKKKNSIMSSIPEAGIVAAVPFDVLLPEPFDVLLLEPPTSVLRSCAVLNHKKKKTDRTPTTKTINTKNVHQPNYSSVRVGNYPPKKQQQFFPNPGRKRRSGTLLPAKFDSKRVHQHTGHGVCDI